jgi:hypothetical protein
VVVGAGVDGPVVVVEVVVVGVGVVVAEALVGVACAEVDVGLIVDVGVDHAVVLVAPVVLADCCSLEQAAARTNNPAASTDLMARTVVPARCDV